MIDSLDPKLGGPVEAARLYASLSGPSCAIEVLSLDAESTKWQANWSVPIHAIGRTFTYYRYSPVLVDWLQSRIASFDAVVVHGIWHYHLLGVCRALRGRPVPYFVILHGMLNPWFKRTYPQKHLKKTIFWNLGVHRAIREAAAVLFLCDEERRLAFETFRFEPQSMEFVPLGTSAQRHSPELLLSRFPEMRGKRLWLFLGRICYMKGCDLLLQAFAQVARTDADVHLVMSGPDHENWQKGCVRTAVTLGVQARITWTGALYGDLKASALSAAELFLLPSRCETFPIAVLEALACSTPVIITDDVNIHPAIRDSRAGLICQTSAASLSKALETWTELSPEQRGAYRHASRRCYERHYDLKAAAQKHIEALSHHLPARQAECSPNVHQTGRT